MHKEKTTIYFRTDGNKTIGLGHFFRTLAFAEILKDEFNCIFILQNSLDSLTEKLTKLEYKWSFIPTFSQVSEEAVFLNDHYLSTKDFVVLDGYQFNYSFQSTLKESGCAIIKISDYGEPTMADIIINPAGNNASINYPNAEDSVLCFGPKYALLQSAFLNKKDMLPKSRKNLFISLGGADEFNVVHEVLKEILKKDIDGTIYTVLGQGYRFKNQILNFIAQQEKLIIPLFSLSSEEMSYYMQQCQVAICTPSTVAYEYLSIGGALYLKPTVDNQKNIYQFLIEQKLAFSFNDFGQISAEQQKLAFLNQPTYFDGQSHQRLLKTVRKLDFQKHVAFRPTEESDFLLYYRWTIDPAVRQFSINKTRITFEIHDQWFFKKINQANCYMYVLMYKNIPAGQIRFEVKGDHAVISYSLDQSFRGRGLGAYLLAQGVQKFQMEISQKLTIIGQVFKQNYPSICAFRRLGFQSAAIRNDLLEYRLKAS